MWNLSASRVPLLLTMAFLSPTAVFVVNAQTSRYLCEGVACEESYTETCEELIIEYDWSGSCCSLADNGIGGCNLTVVNGDCTNTGPMYYCDMGSTDNPFAVNCLGSLVALRNSLDTEGDECPASDYEFRGTPIMVDMLKGLQMTLSGLSAPLTYEQAQVWQELTETRTLMAYADTANDIQTYISIFPEEAFPIDPDANGDVTIIYLQQIAWRSPENDTSLGAMSFLEGAFGNEDNSVAYLNLLTESEAFASVTSYSFGMLDRIDDTGEGTTPDDTGEGTTPDDTAEGTTPDNTAESPTLDDNTETTDSSGGEETEPNGSTEATESSPAGSTEENGTPPPSSSSRPGFIGVSLFKMLLSLVLLLGLP